MSLFGAGSCYCLDIGPYLSHGGWSTDKHSASNFMLIELVLFQDNVIWFYNVEILAWNEKKSRFGEFLPLNIIFTNNTPKRHFLTRKHAFWVLIGRYRSYDVTWRSWQKYEQELSKPRLATPLHACVLVTYLLIYLGTYLFTRLPTRYVLQPLLYKLSKIVLI